MPAFDTVVLMGVVIVAELSLTYVLACVIVTWAWHRTTATRPPQHKASGSAWPSVAVLKPLCGLEPDLTLNLGSFCDQAYPQYEVIMGARDPSDPALRVAADIARQPGRPARVVIGAPSLGSNLKVNTLAHLGAHTQADIVVIADSDIRVDRHYLAAVVEPLLDPTVGVVTCLYRGAPTDSLWSRFGALAINEWFLPSVLVSRALGSETYCSGSTMAMRREVLQAIGGFEALAPLLADDHELGVRIRRLGLRSIVSHYEVATTVDEPSFAALLNHELRWMRTIRTVQPLGHLCLLVTYALPLTLLAAVLGYQHPLLLGLPVLALLGRLALHSVVSRGPVPVGRDSARLVAERWHAPWLVPIRDLMSFGIWVASFANRRVVWRRQAMIVRPDGVLHGGEEVMPA
jgi:ceramide glucosyltransferase